MSKKIKVLIVDDSAVVRQALSTIINSDRAMEVLATASDPYIAVKKIQKEIPDVITLDIEMPRMDGLTFLKRIMSQHPIPVIVISSLTEKGTETAMKALEYGAVEVITKPQLHTKEFIEEAKIKICDAVKAAAVSKIKKKISRPLAVHNFPPVPPKLSADAIIPPGPAKAMIKTTDIVISAGASTGGTEALKVFLENMPLDCPGIVIVQHMPEMFTRSFAERLNDICKITVKEAVNNDSVLKGQALIAPGNKHMLLKRSGARYYVEVKEGPLVNRHRPSVDVLFRSTARYAGPNAIGIIMTGMGDDGARGLLEMKAVGAMTIAQDEKSSVVFGMPNEAIKHGAVKKILPLDSIAPEIVKMV